MILADIGKSQIVLDHKEIPGFMKGMLIEIGYPVRVSLKKIMTTEVSEKK